MGVSAPVLPLYLQTVGASYAVIGTVVSAAAIGRLIATLPSSGLLTRLSMRNGMLVGLTILTAALLAMTWVNTIVVIFICWFTTGIGFTLYELARHQFIVAQIANQHRGRSVSVVGGVFRLGNVIGPIIGGWTAQLYGFRTPFFIMAGCAVVTAVIIFITIPNTTPPRQPFSLGSYSKDLWHTLQNYRYILLVAGSGQLMMQLVRRTRSIIVPLYAANSLGLDVATIGIVISIGSALDTVMFIPAGLILDKFGRKMAIIPSLILQAIGLLILPLATSFAALIGVVSLMGIGNGISAGTMLTLGADLAPKEQPAPFLALWRISSSLGFALGPNVVGAVAALLTLPIASMTAGGIGLLAALIFYRFVPETLKLQPAAKTQP